MEELTVTEETRVQRVKKFLVKHKVKFAVAGTATACLVINRLALKQHDDFLREHDLYDEFYTLDEDE